MSTPRPNREKMPAGDAAWLHMDRPTNRLIVNSVMWFNEPLDRLALRALIQTRLIDRFPRFRQRVIEQGQTTWWQDDEDFDLDRHVRDARLPEPGGDEELHRYVSEYAGESLRRDRPLWELHLIENYGPRGSAIFVRIHHCVADGVALSRLMLSLTDDPALAVPVGNPAPTPGLGALAADLVHPKRAMTHALEAMSGARAVARLATLSPDARTSLRGDVGQSKTIIWSTPLRLRAVRDAARAAEVTVNDLLLTAVTGGLRAHLARTDGRSPDVRAVIPVDLRHDGDPLPEGLGNRFGLMFLRLPVSVDDPRERLAEMRRRTTALKRSSEAAVTFKLLDIIGHLPYAGEQVVVELLSSKASAVMTNVMGPTQPVYLAGVRVRGTIGWPPESGHLGLGVSIISYDGEIVIGLMTDDRLVPDPRRLLRETCAELDSLLLSRIS